MGLNLHMSGRTQFGSMQYDKGVIGIGVDLRDLIPLHTVADRQRMKSEDPGQKITGYLIATWDVHPVHAVAACQKFGQVSGGFLHRAIGLGQPSDVRAATIGDAGSRVG